MTSWNGSEQWGRSRGEGPGVGGDRGDKRSGRVPKRRGRQNPAGGLLAARPPGRQGSFYSFILVLVLK